MEKLMNFDEAKEYLKTSKPTLYRLLQGKQIPAFKVGRQWRIDKDRLDLWMKETENMNQ